MQRFNREPFAYTLKPPATGADGVDDFLFDTRSGFCAHYAGAMAFVLRAAGIPARVVAGYQGGELNPAGNYLLVHQFDAHACRILAAGAGLAERRPDLPGGARTDRTAGLEQALAGDSEYLADAPLSPLRYRGLPWLNDMRLAWDSLNYGWQRWVLAYQGEQQGAFLQRWFGGLDPTRLGLLLGAAAILSVGLLALFLLKPWQGRGDLRSRQLRRFERLLEMHGLRRSPAKGYAPTASAPPASCRRRRQPSRPSSARSKRNAMDTAVPMIQGCVCAHCAGRCPGAWCARPRGMAGERSRHDGVHR